MMTMRDAATAVAKAAELRQATIILALDGHSAATEAANRIPFFEAQRIVTDLLRRGVLVIEDGYGAPFPADINVTLAASRVWLTEVSAKRPPVVQES